MSVFDITRCATSLPGLFSRSPALLGHRVSGFSAIGYGHAFHCSCSFLVEDPGPDQTTSDSHTTAKENPKTAPFDVAVMDQRVEALKTMLQHCIAGRLDRLNVEVTELRKSREKVVFLIVVSIIVGVVLKLLVYDHYMEDKMRAEIHSVEERLSSEIRGIRAETEEIKGSVDKMQGLLIRFLGS